MEHSVGLNRFVGKVAVVTGASASIGKAIAESLVKEGVIVAGLARRLERLKHNAEELNGYKGKLYPYQCDLTKQVDILSTFKRITEELGPIHILINNAGVMIPNNIINGDIEKWKPVLDTNVLAVGLCTREAIASMKVHNIKGHIININSITGHTIVDVPKLGFYPATKYAITALTDTVRLEIIREKLPIKISSLSPGYVKTEMAERALVDKEIKQIYNNVPSLKPKDIADASLYILSTPVHVNIKELTVTVQGSEL